MTTLQPQHPEQYRSLPAPHTMYGPPPPGYHPGPMQYPQSQPAPRQRTAIACRYCRRRKVRAFAFPKIDKALIDCLLRSAALDSISQKMGGAQTVSAFRKSVSSRQSLRRHRLSYLRTPFGAIRDPYHSSSTAHTASPFLKARSCANTHHLNNSIARSSRMDNTNNRRNTARQVSSSSKACRLHLHKDLLRHKVPAQSDRPKSRTRRRFHLPTQPTLHSLLTAALLESRVITATRILPV